MQRGKNQRQRRLTGRCNRAYGRADVDLAGGPDAHQRRRGVAVVIRHDIVVQHKSAAERGRVVSPRRRGGLRERDRGTGHGRHRGSGRNPTSADWRADCNPQGGVRAAQRNHVVACGRRCVVCSYGSGTKRRITRTAGVVESQQTIQRVATAPEIEDTAAVDGDVVGAIDLIRAARSHGDGRVIDRHSARRNSLDCTAAEIGRRRIEDGAAGIGIGGGKRDVRVAGKDQSCLAARSIVNDT